MSGQVWAVFLIFSILIFGTLYPAYAEVFEWMVVKLQFFEQTSNNVQPTTPSFYSLESRLNTTSSSDFASVILNGAPGGPEILNQIDFGHWEFFHDELTKPALDAAFPNQPYTISTSGGNLGIFNEAVSFGPDVYPTQVPYLTGNTFNDLQGMDSSQDITWTWNSPSSGGPQVNEVLVFISDSSFSTLFFSAGGLPPTSTAITIPGGTLDPNKSYVGEVIFQAGVNDPRDSFLTGTGRTGFAFDTEFAFSTASSSTSSQATGQVSIQGTCGLSFPNGNSVNYGSLIPNSISPEVRLNMTNSGTVPATLDVSGSNWVDGGLASQMLVNRTHYNVTSGTYFQKAPLQSFDQLVTSNFIPAALLQTFWQLQAILLNPSFTGATTQTMDFTVGC